MVGLIQRESTMKKVHPYWLIPKKATKVAQPYARTVPELPKTKLVTYILSLGNSCCPSTSNVLYRRPLVERQNTGKTQVCKQTLYSLSEEAETSYVSFYVFNYCLFHLQVLPNKRSLWYFNIIFSLPLSIKNIATYNVVLHTT